MSDTVLVHVGVSEARADTEWLRVSEVVRDPVCGAVHDQLRDAVPEAEDVPDADGEAEAVGE